MAKAIVERNTEKIFNLRRLNFMEKRYEENLKEIKERMELTFEVLEEQEKVKVKELDMEINLYSRNYTDPPIPEGYEHIEGEWNTGFVIERESDASQFVWVPVGSLKPNGTLDGWYFCEKFGRRKFGVKKEWARKIFDEKSIIMFTDYYRSYFKEELEGELLEQLDSVKKYGGFYVSRFLISHRELPGEYKDNMWRNLRPQSKRGEYPNRMIGYISDFEEKEDIKAHLIYGAEYDSMIEWFLETDAISLDKLNLERAFKKKEDIIYNTGSKETVKLNNIYDFGNVYDRTSEKKRYNEEKSDYDKYVECYRCWYNPVLKCWRSHRNRDEYDKDGFRICLYLK